jgi:hypothetical protein
MLSLSVLVLIRGLIIVTGCTMAKSVSGTIVRNGEKRPSSLWTGHLTSLANLEQFGALVVSARMESHRIWKL